MTATGPHISDGNRRSSIQARLKSSSLYRSIKGSRGYWRVKLFLKRVAGRELWLRRSAETPTRETAEWLYAPDALSPRAIVYCFGVGDSIVFEEALIDEHAVTVHAFDPTPAAVRWIWPVAMPSSPALPAASTAPST